MKGSMASNWDERWMDLATLISGWSKDRSRKIGCVIVNDLQSVVSLGWNGFPRNINDDIENRHDRPQKYEWTEHAERNAIYNATLNNTSVRGCTLYCTWHPCTDCARGIIQTGIKRVVCAEPDWEDIDRWSAKFKMVKKMLDEANIHVEYMNGYGPIEV